MKKKVIITASGLGVRLGTEIPKQFLLINNKPILFYTIEQFYNYSKNIEIILTLNKNYIDYWKKLVEKYNFNIKHKIVIGGETRFESVKNAINTINDTNCLVAIHDAVRPFVNITTITNCFNTAKEKGNAIPFINITDSVRVLKNNISKSVNRDNYILVQTPQIFNIEILKKAYIQNNNTTFTDDAGIIESFNEKLNLVKGEPNNFKITTKYDLELAKYQILSKNK